MWKEKSFKHSDKKSVHRRKEQINLQKADFSTLSPPPTTTTTIKKHIPFLYERARKKKENLLRKNRKELNL